MTTSWTRIALLYAIGVIAAGQMGIVPPLVPSLQRDLGLSLTEAGAAVSIITLIGALLGLPAGRWCEAAGHRRALAIGLLIMAAAAGLCPVAQDAITLLAARALAGIGYLLVVVAAPSLMASVAEPRHHAYTLSLWGTFVPAGIALAGFVGASFPAANWRSLFVIDAAALAVGAIAVLAEFPRPAGRPREDRSMSLEPLVRALPLSVAFFCFALLFLAVAALLPSYLVERRGLAASDAGRIAAVAAGFGIAGSLAAAGILRRGIAAARLVALGLLASTALAALSFIDGVPMPLAVAGFALAYALGGLVPAACFASAPALAGRVRGVGLINGLLAQTGSLGSLAGPPALALWVGWAGWSAAPALLLLIAIGGAASALAVRPASPPPQTTSCPTRD
jgi:predicted MFS family arabinose efflux permease